MPFHKGLEHLQNLVSLAGPGTNPSWTPRTTACIQCVYNVHIFFLYIFYTERIRIFIRIFHKFKNSVILGFQRN